MESSGNSVTGDTAGFRCVRCDSPIRTLYIQYSPGNIRLMKCEKCKAVADEYIECEVMILIIDLILHKPKAYRHVLYNILTRGNVDFQSFLWKSVMMYHCLDIYQTWALSAKETEWKSSMSFTSLLLEFGEILICVVSVNLIVFCILIHAVQRFLSASDGVRGWKHIMLALCISSYFKIFLMAMMVWEFPSFMIFIIDIFVLSSNTVALKVITNSGMMQCMVICIIAHSLKLLLTHGQNKILK